MPLTRPNKIEIVMITKFYKRIVVKHFEMNQILAFYIYIYIYIGVLLTNNIQNHSYLVITTHMNWYPNKLFQIILMTLTSRLYFLINLSFYLDYLVINFSLYIYIYIYIVIHRQICFVLSELISVARQYLPVAGIETQLTQTPSQSF